MGSPQDPKTVRLRQDLVATYRSSRSFEPARHQRTLFRHGPQHSFRLLTYNLLCHIHRPQFPYCSRETLKWAYRRERLISEVEAYQADICAFQEMDHYEKFFRAELERLGYQSMYGSKREDGHGDGICLAWNPARFALLDTKVLSFAETMKHLPNAVPNLALLVLLQDGRTGRKLVLATTHLYWHWEFDHLRAIQAQFLFESLTKWCRCSLKLSDYELIVCGDFNSDPKSIAYELITRKPIRSDHYDFVMAKSGLSRPELSCIRSFFSGHDCPPMRSAYACQAVRMNRSYGAYGELPWSTLTTTRDTLDYIFFREDGRIAVHQLLMLPSDSLVLSEQALPNSLYCSDHIALVAEFSYKT